MARSWPWGSQIVVKKKKKKKKCKSNDLVFNIYGNNFIKPTKNVNKEYETKFLDKQIKGVDKENLSNIRCIWSTKT